MLNLPFETDPKTEKMQILLIRKSKISDRISLLSSLSQTVVRLSRRAIARANPGISEKELDCKFVAYHYGNEIAEQVKKYLTDGGL